MNILEQQEIEGLEEKVKGFIVNDLSSANWCIKRMQTLEHRITENTVLAEQEKAKIDKWLKAETEQDMLNKQSLEVLVKEYFKSEREKDKKFKLSTPYGKVSSRKTKKYKYDELTLKEYCKENGYTACIRVTEDLDKATFKKMFKDGINQETGELIDCVIVEEVESISVKVE